MSPDQGFVSSPRLNYYNPKLDLPTQVEKMTEKMREAIIAGTYDDGSVAQSGPLNEPDLAHPYNLVSSLCEDRMHRPALDIDIDAAESEISWRVAVAVGVDPLDVLTVKSTNHWHAYVPSVVLEWADYVVLLVGLMAETGRPALIERNYFRASLGRGQTLLRPPHVLKKPPTETEEVPF